MREIVVVVVGMAWTAACQGGAGGGDEAPAGADLAAEETGTGEVAMDSVRPGVSVFLDSVPGPIRGKRVGLITNQTGRDAGGTSTIDLLHGSDALELVALYSPEHGIRGEAVGSETDERTGLPIHSLYGETRQPTPGMLDGVEALLFDIQDIGTRQYTYISTMKLAMEAAAEVGIPFVVLDRPDPIGGHIVEGNILEEAHESFVGIHPIPVRHGMTIGELARMFDAEDSMGVDLAVARVAGWSRDEWWDETGLPWVNPSPNIRRLEAATHYPGTVFLEATNLSEGRGTDSPFEQTGAPWLDAAAVVDSMNALDLPGIRFDTVTLTVEETAAKYPGRTLPGVRYVLTDREAYRPVATTLRLIDVVRGLHPDDFAWRGDTSAPAGMPLTRHAGSTRLFEAYEAGTLPALLEEWRADAEGFAARRQPFLLYD
jgi:uncharacterized protein YbbC (DUF1343 family)